MPFTDEDLKRFKRWIQDCFETDKFFCRTHEIEALLARLEAAERVCKELDGSMRSGLIESDALIKWRKEAGK